MLPRPTQNPSTVKKNWTGESHVIRAGPTLSTSTEGFLNSTMMKITENYLQKKVKFKGGLAKFDD